MMQPSEQASTSYSDVMRELFSRLRPEVRETLLLGAIPHVLDSKLAEILFPGAVKTNFEIIRSFRFTSEPKPGQIEYHDLARRYLLDLWLKENPDRFRQFSNLLATEYRRRLDETSVDSTIHASEWLFHNLAVDPPNGIRLIANLFEELIECRELGSAEHLARLVEEQKVWIGNQSAWLDYFESSLAFSNYQDINVTHLERHIAEQANTTLAACCLRLLGRIAVRNQHWAEGRKHLLEALKICNLLGDSYNQALSHMDLGDLFQNLVKSSGGILVETREFSSFFPALLYTLSQGPFLLYRRLAERVNFLPNLYSMNYQNWVALHLMRLALRNYRSAEKRFKQLANRRGQVEINSRMVDLLFALGHTASAEHLSIVTLKESIVQNSPYYTARFESVLGQGARQRKHFVESSKKLSDSLEIYERYNDWDSAARAALNLGEIYGKTGESKLVLETYERCLNAARRSQNILLQSEVAHHLDELTRKDILQPSLRQSVIDMRQTITKLAFIDRYPGPVQKAFRNLSKILTLPSIVLLFLFTIVTALGAQSSVSFIAGEARVPYKDPAVWWTQAGFLSLWLFLPLLMLWGYNMAYALLGQFVILGLKFTKVDEAQPNIFVLDNKGISQESQSGGSEKRISWEDARIAVIDDRALFRTPLNFSSSLKLQGNGEELLIPASTFRYMELENEVMRRLEHRRPPVHIVRNILTILHIPSINIALVLGLVLAAVIVIGLGLYSCYGIVPPQGSECPPENRLYYLPIIPFGIFFATVFFGIISLVRWISTNQRIKKASIHG